MKIEKPFRFIGLFLTGFLAFWIGWKIFMPLNAGNHSDIQFAIYFGAIGALIGFFFIPFLFVYPIRRLRLALEDAGVLQLTSAVLGWLVGLILSALISVPLALLPNPVGKILPFFVMLFFSYLSIRIALANKDEFRFLLPPWYQEKKRTEPKGDSKLQKIVLLDTSVIIDGRIAEIARTGFVPGIMVIPHFILSELQRIADSEDFCRRQRGRRGLEILCQLQNDLKDDIQFSDLDFSEIRDVDTKLITMAKQLNCGILTNDYNLNRIADLQGIRILNINDLANAVKSIVLPGESLDIRVIQDGKEYNQGVGFMEDGTMVVVENGRNYMNRDISVLVTKVFQTSAGRMIFARFGD